MTTQCRRVTENEKAWDKVPPMLGMADGRAQDTERVAVGETSSEWSDPSSGKPPLPSGSVAEGGEGSGAKRGLQISPASPGSMVHRSHMSDGTTGTERMLAIMVFVMSGPRAAM